MVNERTAKAMRWKEANLEKVKCNRVSNGEGERLYKNNWYLKLPDPEGIEDYATPRALSQKPNPLFQDVDRVLAELGISIEEVQRLRYIDMHMGITDNGKDPVDVLNELTASAFDRLIDIGYQQKELAA